MAITESECWCDWCNLTGLPHNAPSADVGTERLAASARLHAAHPELINAGGAPCDNECGGRATSPAEGRCPDCVEFDQAKAVQR